MKIIITLLCVLAATVCFGQAETITWQSQSVKNLRFADERSYSCSFRISSDKVLWTQSRRTDEFTISSSTGKLPETGPGEVTYHVAKDGMPGDVIVRRLENGTVTLTVDFAKQGASPIAGKYEFIVLKD